MGKSKKEEEKAEEPQTDQQNEPAQADPQEKQPDEAEARSEDELTPYQPQRPPLENAGLDQRAAEATRESERDAQREEHNRRVGDASRR